MSPLTPLDSVEEMLMALTLEEKVALLSGKNMWETAEIPRLSIPSLKMTDGPAGARGFKWSGGSLTTVVPCGVSLAATFDPELVELVGTVLGGEAKRKGCHVLLAPTMNLSRSPLGGRNFEGFGEDPFLAGVMSASIVKGVQRQGVGACIKHFVANDTETRRFNVDQTIDQRTLREVYMKPFSMVLDSVTPWTAMVSYPLINGHHADMSPHILQPLLREELGFDGLVISDWGGTNSTARSLIATTDLEMPGPPIRRGAKLLEAIKRGDVSEIKHVDPSVRRVLRVLEHAGLFPAHTTASLGAASQSGHEPHDVMEWSQEAKLDSEKVEMASTYQEITQRAAEDGLVLLKNDGGMLPLQLDKIKSLAIVGPNARKPLAGGAGSAAVNPFYITTPEEAIREAVTAARPATVVEFEPGMCYTSRPPLMGRQLRTPDDRHQGLTLTFFRGFTFEGEPVAKTAWPDSMVYLFSDGDTPAALIGKDFSYRAEGVLTPCVSANYAISLASTGQAKLYLDEELVVDNSEWEAVTGGFLGLSSEDRVERIWLEAGRTYRLKVDNVASRPTQRPFDNTFFPFVSGLRIGLAQEQNEDLLRERAVDCARRADAVIVVVGHNKDSEGEGGDRVDMALPGHADDLVEAVCAANPNTVVVLQAASAINMPWLHQARALVMAWYQGQENGVALAQALLGKSNFSGKLPITIPKHLSDHGTSDWFPAEAAQDHCVFGEGIMFGYRHFDQHAIQPQWPFGYGLSYTRFIVSDITASATVSEQLVVTAQVANVGDYAGHEVVQVYTAPSGNIAAAGLMTYRKTLSGFAKVLVPVGEQREVTIRVPIKELRWFNEATGSWRLDKVEYSYFVGTSSAEIRHEGRFEIV